VEKTQNKEEKKEEGKMAFLGLSGRLVSSSSA
jgi:hypothetical protein